jgi:DNA-binding response OmpR family regulator
MTSYAFRDDGSTYARDLLEGLDLLGVLAIPVDDTDELLNDHAEDMAAFVLMNPSSQMAREARDSLKKVGGWVARIPLIAAMDSMERLEEQVTLRTVDDFLVYPGGAGELIARVRVIMLRHGGQGDVANFGALVINIDAHQVMLEGKPIDLTFKEFELLRTLSSSPGRVYTREELLKTIWGYDYFGGTRTVDVHVRRLRAKIEGSFRYIETVHSVGYRFARSGWGKDA